MSSSSSSRGRGKGRPKGTTNQPGARTPGPESSTNKRRRTAKEDANKKAWSGFGFTAAGSDGGGASAQPENSSGVGVNAEEATGRDPGVAAAATAAAAAAAAAAGASSTSFEPQPTSGQKKFVSEIKANISKAAPKHNLQKPYPYEDMWVYPPDPTMRKTIRVEDHHLRPVFVWLPEFTHPRGVPGGRLPCPRCKTTKDVIVKGWTQKGSRRAILRNSCCDLLGKFYRCNGCAERNKSKPKKCKTRVPESFQGWDPEVRKLLPLYVQESFPFVLTRKSAIHRDVIADVADNLMHAKGFKASSEALEQAHRHKFHSAELKYYNMLLWRRAEQLDSGAEDRFGSFEDAKGYNGFFPSAHYLSSVWSTSMQQAPVAKLDKHVKGVEGEAKWTRELFLQLRQQLIDGRLLKVDQSFKVAKLVRVRIVGGVDTKPFHSVVTFFNEFEQVVFQKALQSASLREVKQDIKALFVTRYKGSGFEPPELLSTDECCLDKALMDEIFKELSAERHHFSVTNNAPEASECPILLLPPDVKLGDPVKANQDSPCLKAAVDAIRTHALANSNVIGLDIEWEISAAGAPVNPPATIQLAAGKVVVIFHVLHGQRAVPVELPTELVDLLEDDTLTKTGVGIKGDCTRLSDFYGVQVAGVVDLRSLAVERKVEVGLRRGLADLCVHLLGVSLPKDPSVRISRWNSAKLSQEQKMYAALDAYACLLLHTRIKELSDPIFGEEDDLCVGDKVLMYTRGGNDRVAEGCIVEYGQRWGTTGVFLEPRQTTRGHARRWAVRLEKVHVARAKALYPDESDPRGATTAQIGKLASKIVLWDASRLRKISAATAAATEADCNGGSALPAEAGGASVTSVAEGIPNTDGGGSEGADAPTSTGVTASREGGAGGRETFVTPSEPFFAGQLSGIEALSSEAVAYSTTGGKGSALGEGCEGGGGDGQETVVDVTGDVSEANHEEFSFLKVAGLAVKLDAFHAMQRLSKLILKSHGACRAYLARLRDAFFKVNADDLAAVQAALLLAGMSQEEVDAKKAKDWAYFLKRCRRMIPPPVELAERFDLVNKVYGGLLDNKTKQPLLRPEALEAAKRLREHIVADCCSDAPKQALYFEAGKDPETLCALFRCVRGTNDLEGYHFHMRLLVAWCLSPRLAHLLLLEHNYRWNLRQSIKNRGVSEVVGGFYDQPMLEAIQRMTSTLYGHAKYSEWLPTSAYADTGERSGFVPSIFASHVGGDGGVDSIEEIVGGEDNCGLYSPSVGEVVPLPELTGSAASLAEMQEVQVPCMPISSATEKTKFNAMWMGFVRPAGRQSLLDFDRFALEWNKAVSLMEEGKSAVIPIFRKTAGHLKAYWTKHHENINIRSTLRPLYERDGPLKNLLRVPDDAGGRAVAVAQPWVLEAPDSYFFPEQLPPLSVADGQEVSLGGAVPAVSGGQGASADGAPSAGDVVTARNAAAAVSASGQQGASESSGAAADGSSKRARRPQHCIDCGHKMRTGPFKKYHSQVLAACQPKICEVPANLRRVAKKPGQQNSFRKFGGECECTGDAEHPGGCKAL